jgi:membrane protein DedA with SNARE-associated domain
MMQKSLEILFENLRFHIESMPLIQYLMLYKYLAVFIAVFIEGPVVMAAVGFLIKLGYLQASLAYPLLVLGDLTSDIAWYYSGYFGFFNVLSSFSEFIGFKKNISDRVARLYKKNETKILFISKITMGLGFSLIVLVTAGMLRVSLKKFAAINFMGGLVWTAIIVTLGYLFGSLYLYLEQGLRISSLVIFAVLFLAVFFSLGNYFRRKYFGNSNH